MTTSPSLIVGIGLLDEAQRVLGFVVSVGFRQVLLRKAQPIGTLRIDPRIALDRHRHGCAGTKLKRLIQLDVLAVEVSA
jgi:hypothetical protein